VPGETALDVMIRLFVGGTPVEPAAAERAFGPLGVDGWCRAGLVDVSGGLVRPLMALTPITLARDWVLAHDLPSGRPVRTDHVQGVGPTAVVLAGATIRARPGPRSGGGRRDPVTARLPPQ
jgi:hypothetical protein